MLHDHSAFSARIYLQLFLCLMSKYHELASYLNKDVLKLSTN
jgi:hypothetical protein